MYSNFCDENHTYHLAHYGRPGMKWGKHIFGGRDKAFSKSGVRRVRTNKDYEWGGFNNAAFYEKSPNYDAAVTKLLDRVNVINGQPGRRYGMAGRKYNSAVNRQYNGISYVKEMPDGTVFVNKNAIKGANSGVNRDMVDATKDFMVEAGYAETDRSSRSRTSGKPGKSGNSSNSKWYEQATTAQRKRGVTGMAGRNVRGAVDETKKKIRDSRNHNSNTEYKPTNSYREYLSASQATTARKKASKGFPSPTQPGETFKRRKDGDPKLGHYTKHPEQKKSVAPSKSSNARGGNENWKGDYSRESFDKLKSTAVRRGLKNNLVVGDKDKHRAMLEAQSQPRKRRRGARR